VKLESDLASLRVDEITPANLSSIDLIVQLMQGKWPRPKLYKFYLPRRAYRSYSADLNIILPVCNTMHSASKPQSSEYACESGRATVITMVKIIGLHPMRKSLRIKREHGRIIIHAF